MSYPTTPVVSAGDFGRASWADAVVSDLTQLALAIFPLGGSLEASIPGTAEVLAFDARGVRLYHANYIDNFVWTIQVWGKVGSGGSCVPVIKDDLGATIHTFSAFTGTSLTAQRFEFTPSAARTYFLYFTNASASIEAFGYGEIIRSADTLPS